MTLVIQAVGKTTKEMQDRCRVGARLHALVGPMGNPDAVDLKYEEFFLSSWACGDPAMLVDGPANCRVNDPSLKATRAFYPDDPSNVYHSYLRDHTKFRILHAGTAAGADGGPVPTGERC